MSMISIISWVTVIGLLVCIVCIYATGTLSCKVPKQKKEHPIETNTILLLWLLFLTAGCSSPVTMLRAISKNNTNKQITSTIESIMQSAQNAALRNERYTMARFSAPESDVKLIARQLHNIDRRFIIEIQPTELFTTLIVRW